MNYEQGPFKAIGGAQAGRPSLVGRIVGGIIGIILLAGALVVSVFLFAALAVVGVVLWGFLWWKTRAVRKQMREHLERMQEQMNRQGASSPAAAGGDVIEGEFVREEVRDETRKP
jgi:predicted lipid-binding transport protein (Tim44 family)